MQRPIVTFLAFITACMPTPSAVGQSFGDTCTAREISRQPVRDEAGMEMYVEPVAFSASDGIALLAGTPNYVYGAGRAGAPLSVTRDSVFGMVIGAGGSSRTVPSPVAGLPASVRTLPRKEGGWEVVFAELPSGYRFPERVPLVALWYGVLEGTRWITLEKLPLPASERLTPFNASRLESHGDTISWGLTYESATGDGIALFQRRLGQWQLELIPVPGIAFVSLAQSPRDGLVLLPVRGDASPGQANTLYLYTRNPLWRPLRRLVAGEDEPVFDVQATITRDGDAITWWAALQNAGAPRREARAMLGALTTTNAGVVLLDSNVLTVHAVPMRDGIPLWVTHGPKPQSNELELRFMLRDARGKLRVARLDDPFDGPFSVFESAPSTLLIAGPVLRRSGDGATLVSSLLRVAIDCAAS